MNDSFLGIGLHWKFLIQL